MKITTPYYLPKLEKSTFRRFVISHVGLSLHDYHDEQRKWYDYIDDADYKSEDEEIRRFVFFDGVEEQ